MRMIVHAFAESLETGLESFGQVVVGAIQLHLALFGANLTYL